MTLTRPIDLLQTAFGDRVKTKVPLAPYSSARVGGAADILIDVTSSAELEETVERLWDLQLPFLILGGGSNILVSDHGVREVVILNRARQVEFRESQVPLAVWAESGANFGQISRQAAARGFGGLEWAAGIPGTVGGAIVGNAGAHGGDVSGDLLVAEILHLNKGRTSWTAEQLMYGYRTSVIKRHPGDAVVLAGTFRLHPASKAEIKKKMDSFLAYRRKTQPPGATMGSMFKNPPEDYAGRLIEAAGLKGLQIGGAQISSLHANFFINRGEATATQIWMLINHVQQTVANQFGVLLELEIELVGDWIRNANHG